MPRPIDADVLKDKLMYLPGGYAQSFAGKACLMAIDDAPTLEYAPVRHGEWGAAEIVGYDGIFAVYAVPCSACKEYTELYRARYCPNCGAKMDAKGDAHV